MALLECSCQCKSLYRSLLDNSSLTSPQHCKWQVHFYNNWDTYWCCLSIPFPHGRNSTLKHIYSSNKILSYLNQNQLTAKVLILLIVGELRAFFLWHTFTTTVPKVATLAHATRLSGTTLITSLGINISWAIITKASWRTIGIELVFRTFRMMVFEWLRWTRFITFVLWTFCCSTHQKYWR